MLHFLRTGSIGGLGGLTTCTLERVDEAGLLVQTMTADDDRTFSVRHRRAGWAYACGPTGSAAPDAQVDEAAVSDMVTDLASFIAYFPGMP